MTLVPALVALAVVILALFGENGLLRRHELRRQLILVNQEVDRLAAENRELRWEIRRLKDSSLVVRRAAAEGLLMGEPGSTIYRFSGSEAQEDDDGGSPAPAGEAGR